MYECNCYVGLQNKTVNSIWYVKTSVVDPNTLNLDPDPGFWPNLDPDWHVWIRIRITNLHVWTRIRIQEAPEYGSNTDPDPQHW